MLAVSCLACWPRCMRVRSISAAGVGDSVCSLASRTTLSQCIVSTVLAPSSQFTLPVHSLRLQVQPYILHMASTTGQSRNNLQQSSSCARSLMIPTDAESFTKGRMRCTPYPRSVAVGKVARDAGKLVERVLFGFGKLLWREHAGRARDHRQASSMAMYDVVVVAEINAL